MALADDELTVGKSHARNGEWVDITIRKRHIMEPIWYLDSRCSRSMTDVKSYLHKYVEQQGSKVVFGDNSSCITEGYGLVNYGGYSSVSKAFKVYNTNRQQIEETYHVTFDESIQYKVDYDISYYVIPRGRSLTKLTQENHVPEVIVSNEHDVPLTEDIEDPLDLINTLTTALAGECLFADNLSEIEPKKVSESLKHPGWIDFMNKKYKHGTTTKNKARLVAQDNSQEEGIDYDEAFTPVAKMEAIRIFLSFATYMNFKVYQMDVKSVFLNGKLKEEIYVKQPLGFESSEFPDYVCKLDKALYGLKQAPRACPMCKISVQSKRITSKRCGKNLEVPERKSTLGVCQILGGKLVCWSAKNNTQWLCHQLKLNMLLLLGVVQDLSKVTDIELTAYMIAINKQRDSVSPPPLVAKPTKGMSQTVASTLPKSQGPEASEALSKKRTKPNSKRPLTETKESPPKPTMDFEVTYGQRLRGNKPPADMEPLNTTDADLSWTGAKYQEDQTQSSRLSDEEVLAAGDDMDEDPQDDKEVRTCSLKQDQSVPSHVQESASNSSSPNLKRFDNILPLTERQLIRQDTSEIKSMMTEMGENVTTTATEESPSHTERETKEPRLAISILSIPSTVIPPIQPFTLIIIQPESSQATPKIDKGKGIATESDDDPSKKLVKALSIVRPDPDEPDKEQQIKKAKEEARLNAISKTELHSKTKPVVITVYRGTDGKNFDVHKPFLFGAFGISELDELREIIPKKKNKVVKDLMNSISRRYERLRKIPGELGIQSALPAPEQASSQTS
nr:hypothetical protein [Tanacetum cinerariifolium]